jgi:hypothetical protein
MMNLETAIWRGTAKLASTETDPKKLMALIGQLCREIDQQRQPTAPQFPGLTAVDSNLLGGALRG